MNAASGLLRERTFSVTIRPDGRAPGADHVEVEGDLDLVTRAQLESAVAACLHRQPRMIALNLRRVAFMDCAGTAGLLACCSRALAQHARLVVVEPSVAVTRILTPDLNATLGICRKEVSDAAVREL